jgi:hypothetical protein
MKNKNNLYNVPVIILYDGASYFFVMTNEEQFPPECTGEAFFS